MHTLSRLAFAFGVAALCASRAAAQDVHQHDDDDHDHDHLHFSHPLITESPSPDTKIRVDYTWARAGKAGDPLTTTEQGTRIEGEWAFSDAVSLAVTLPYVWRHTNGGGDVRGVSSTELSLKAASLAFGSHDILVGGGLSAGLPTGSDALGIGSSRSIDVEPFADVAVKRGPVEGVVFAHYSRTVRNPAGEDAEHELGADASLLYAFARKFEALIEFTGAHSTAGTQITNTTSVAPGLKVYPFRNRHIMAGVSLPIGLGGEAKDSHGVLVAAFYHF